MVMTLGDVLFETNEAELAPGARRGPSTRSPRFMNKYPERTAIVEGHTDSMGDDGLQPGSVARTGAGRCAQALMARGVDGSRISTQGYGMTIPVASNSSSAGRAQNRARRVASGHLPGRAGSGERVGVLIDAMAGRPAPPRHSRVRSTTTAGPIASIRAGGVVTSAPTVISRGA